MKACTERLRASEGEIKKSQMDIKQKDESIVDARGQIDELRAKKSEMDDELRRREESSTEKLKRLEQKMLSDLNRVKQELVNVHYCLIS